MKYLLILSIWMTGCVVTDVGNPQTHEKTETPLKLVAYDSSPRTMPNALTLSNGFVVTHAWISINEVEAQGCEVNGVEPDEMTLAPFFVDLVSGQSYPRPIQLASGTTFCELSMELNPTEAVLPGGVPADMLGLSVMVRAIRGDGTPVLIRGDFSQNVRLRGEVTLRDVDSLLVGFAANEWFDESVQTLISENGVVLIDPDTNSDNYDAFADNFKNSSRLFRDEDLNGELDEDDSLLAEYEEEED